MVCVIDAWLLGRRPPSNGSTGTPLFGRKIKANGEFDEITVVRAGIFEDEALLNERGPEAELYTDRRLKWVDPVEGGLMGIDTTDAKRPVPVKLKSLETLVSSTVETVHRQIVVPTSWAFSLVKHRKQSSMP